MLHHCLWKRWVPIQNMIIRGFSNSKLCAFKIINKYDAGPIYKKVPVSLKGSQMKFL